MAGVRCRMVCLQLLVLISLATWLGFARAAEPAPVLINDTRDEYPLGRHLSILEDPSNSLELEQVTAPAYANRFVASPGDSPSYGFSGSAFWARVALQRDTRHEAQWFLELPYAAMHFIDVYLVRTDGSVQHQRGGSALPFDERPVRNPSHLFEIGLPDHEVSWLYVKISGESSKNLPLRLVRGDRMMEMSGLRLATFWTLIGVLVALVGYNLFIYVSVRESAYLHYVLSLVSLMLFVMSLSGLSQQVLWPHQAGWVTRMIPLSGACYGLFTSLFAMQFLRTATFLPRAHRLLVGGLFLFAGVIAASFLASYHVAIVSIAAVGAIFCGVGLLLAIHASLNHHREARFFLLSWAVLLSGIIAYVLRVAGWLPSVFLTEYALFIGAGMQSLLLSVALADRMRILKDERASAIQQLAERERLANLGMLSAGIAHEINNPNHYARMSALVLEKKIHDFARFLNELMQDGEADPEIARLFAERFGEMDEQLALIKEGTGRIDQIVRGMRAGSRADGEAAIIDPVAGLLATVDLVKPTFKTVVNFDTTALVSYGTVRGRSSELNQVFTNLLVNACHAIEDKQRQTGRRDPGNIRLGCTLEDQVLKLTISDDGCGMSEAVRARLFEPFFTTKGADKGTGLGMGICKRILEEHRGRLDVVSEPGAGTTMTVVLPLAG